MAAHNELFTIDFWQRTLTQTVHGGAGAAVGVLGAESLDFLTSVPWYALTSAIAFGALVSFFGSLASVRIPGTVPASFLPEHPPARLVAYREHRRGRHARPDED